MLKTNGGIHLNPIALGMAKTPYPWSFGCSDCSRVKSFRFITIIFSFQVSYARKDQDYRYEG